MGDQPPRENSYSHINRVSLKPRPRPVTAPAAPSGPAIYSRHFPRPIDMPKNMGEVNENLRKMTYADCDITYDIRRIKN